MPWRSAVLGRLKYGHYDRLSIQQYYYFAVLLYNEVYTCYRMNIYYGIQHVA